MAGLLGPLLGLELLLRLAGPVLPGDYQTATFTVPSAILGRQNERNTTGWWRATEYRTFIRLNSKGLRGPEVDYARPPDTFRVVVLGDSFVFAAAVSERETFVRLLGERLNRNDAGVRFETINAGTSGWNTANEYAWLATEGYRYEPDLVLLMFYLGNDSRDNERVGTPEQVEQLNLGVEQHGPLEAARTMLRRVSVAYNFFERGVLAKLVTAPDVDASPEDAELTPEQSLETARRLWDLDTSQRLSTLRDARDLRGWRTTEALLRRIRDYCQARGISLVIVGIPAEFQMRNPYASTTPLPTISQRLGVPEIDLMEHFTNEDGTPRQKLYFREDRHWTPVGHRVAAGFVEKELRRRGLVPLSPS